MPRNKKETTPAATAPESEATSSQQELEQKIEPELILSETTAEGLRPEQWYELMNERYQLLAELAARGETWTGFETESRPQGFGSVARVKKRLFKIDHELQDLKVSTPKQLSEFYQAAGEEEKFSLMLEQVQSINKQQEEFLTQEYQIISEGKKSSQGLSRADREALLEVRQEIAALKQQAEFWADSPETALFYRMAVLEKYRQDLQQKNFVDTPSRQALAERIKFHIENSEPILLEGETGTGKTELALNLCRRLYGGREPEFISGSPDVRASDIFVKQGLKASETADLNKREELAREISDHVVKYHQEHPEASQMDLAQENDNYARIVAASASVIPETYFVYGPLVRAMEQGLPLVIDEANLIETRLRMILKRTYNVRPGQTVPLAGNGQVKVAPGFCLIFTANLKGEKHTERFDFDEAEKRTMINSTIHVGYLPASELYDLLLARAMDSRGEAPLSPQEATETLKNFCDAAVDIQTAYVEGPSEVYAPKDSRGRQQEFKEGVLDAGAALRMLSGLEAKDPAEPLTEFLNRSILNYVSNRNYRPQDRELIVKIFLSKGFLQQVSAKDLEISGLTEAALRPLKVKKQSNPEAAGAKEIKRRQIAELDPYELRKLANLKQGEGFLALAGEGAGSENPELAGEYLFTIRNAINPYGEAMKEGGITNPDLTAERQDITVNLQELLTQDRTAYEQAGLTEWFQSIPENISDLRLTKEQLEVIKSRVEQGEIPIVMPGRQAQLDGLRQAIAKLKPNLIKDGKQLAVADIYHWDYFDKLITVMQEIAPKVTGGRQFSLADISTLGISIKTLVKDDRAVQKLIEAVQSLPENSYIFTIKPEQANLARTRSKTLEQQVGELQRIKQENSAFSLDVLSIGEYLALQNRFTQRADNLSLAQNEKLQTLIPLDDYNRSSGTFSRFINLPVSADGHVPYGLWNSVSAQVDLDGGSVEARDRGGFRVSVRV